MDYHPLTARAFGAAPNLTASQQTERKEWQTKTLLEKPSNRGRVVAISYSPATSATSAVAWSHNIEVLKTHDAKERVFKQDSPFCYNSVNYRRDGELIVYSVGDRGKVAVIDKRGKQLRQFAHHRGAVTGAAFTSGKVNIASWGTDRQVCLTSLATAGVLCSVRDAHEEVIFAGDTSADSEFMAATGCAGGVVKLWDMRVKGDSAAVQTISTGNTGGVQCLRFRPTDSRELIFGTSFGHLRKIDLRYVGEESHTDRAYLASSIPHSKALTDVCFAKDSTRVLSVGLDGKLCVHDADDLKTIYSNHETPTGLTSVGCANDGSELAIGLDSGVLLRKISKTVSSVGADAGDERPQHWSMPPVQAKEDKPSKRLRSDVHLRSFSYKKALLSALDEYERAAQQDSTDYLYAMIDELIRRNALRIALSTWNERDLSRILVYLITHMRHCHRCALMITTVEVINEIYSEEIIRSPLIQKMFVGLQGDLKYFLESTRQAGSLLSTIDAFL